MKALKWVVLVLVVGLWLRFLPGADAVAGFVAGVLLSGPVKKAWERI